MPRQGCGASMRPQPMHSQALKRGSGDWAMMVTPGADARRRPNQACKIHIRIRIMSESFRAIRPQPVAVKRIITETWFFPLAALYGALALPLFAAGWTGLITAPPGLQTSAGHAHELLFGYALAVVCGFLVNRVPGTRLGLLFVLWFAARLSFLFVPESLLAAATNIGFATVVAATAAPRFMKAAKKWRNRLTGPLVLALCACAAAFHLVLARGG